MRCDEVREVLVAYADGELTPEERDRIESHLGACPACRAERVALDSTGDLLALLGKPPPAGKDLAARVLAAAKNVDPWCGHIRRELVALLDGEISEVDGRPVREHLAGCAACAAEARDLERSFVALDGWAIGSFSANLAARILPAGRSLTRGRLVRLMSAAVAACLFVAAGIAIFKGEPAPATPPPEVLRAMEVLDPQTLELLGEDPQLIEIAEDIDWLDEVTDEDIALLAGSGSGG